MADLVMEAKKRQKNIPKYFFSFEQYPYRDKHNKNNASE
jgi:hypothetical protein